MTSSASPITLLEQQATTTARREGAASLWVRLGLFWAPVLLVAGVFEFAMWRSGETWPLEKVLARQKASPSSSVFMREYMPQDQAAYKLLLLSERKPRVMVLSSSRGMQLRAGMIGETNETFLNGGGLLNTVGDLEQFLATTPAERMPKVILLAVDLWWFNEKWPGAARTFDADGAFNWRAHLAAARKVLLRPALLRSLLTAPGAAETGRIGISAGRTGSGFRMDGSVQQVYPVPASVAEWKFEDREVPPVIERVQKGTINFVQSPRVSPERIARLKKALAECKAKGIQVAAFAPPFSTEVYQALTADPRYSELLASFRNGMTEVFREADAPFVDATDLKAFDLDDKYMFDGFHAAETFHLHLIKRLLAAHPATAAMLPRAESAVERLMASDKTNFWYTGIPASE